MDVSSNSWSPDPGISEATQTYGSVLGSAVIVTDLFLVPSALITSLKCTVSTSFVPCLKYSLILGKYPATEHVRFVAEDVMRLQALAFDCSASSNLQSSITGTVELGGAVIDR